MSLHLDGVVPLPHLGVIRVQGEDAARFLQGQLTQDFALLGADEARLAGRQGWPVVALPLHHLAMLTHAEAVAAALSSLAERLEAAHHG